MIKSFLKNNGVIVLVYLVFTIYLGTGIGINNPLNNISEFIYEHSYFLLLLLFVQFFIWRKSNNIKFFKNKILVFSSLLIISFYLVLDMFHLLNEELGWILNALAVLAGIALVLHAVSWLFIFCFTFFQKFW